MSDNVKELFNLLLILSYIMLWGFYLFFAGFYMFLFFLSSLIKFVPAAHSVDSNFSMWLFYDSLIMFIALILMGFGMNVLRNKILFNKPTMPKHDILAIVGFVSTLIFIYFSYKPFFEVSSKFFFLWLCVLPIVFNVFSSLYLVSKTVRLHIRLANHKDN